MHRLLASLEGKRFVERDQSTGLYRLGLRSLQMAYLTLEHNDLRRLSAPFLHRLSQQYRENVNLAVLDGSDVIYIDIVDSPQRVKLAAAIGQRLPAFCTASGKAILAYLAKEKVQQILASGMPAHTPNTIQSPDAYFENMQCTRERGFAISEQEYEVGINAVAAPIYTGSKEPVGSISIAGPSYRFTLDVMLDIGAKVVAIAQEIAKEIRLVTNR